MKNLFIFPNKNCKSRKFTYNICPDITTTKQKKQKKIEGCNYTPATNVLKMQQYALSLYQNSTP
jgi:hypothetical protein